MFLLLIYVSLTAIRAQDYRIALRGSSRPCEGRLELYYNRKWGLVGHHGWTAVNGEVVCKSLGCGKHVNSGDLYHDYKNPPSLHFWLDEINCTGSESNLWNCPSNGWNITLCHNYVSVNCSGEISMRLNLNGVTDECAGVVQFTTPNGVMDVCENHLPEDKAYKACQDLNCGTHKKSMMFKTSGTNGVVLNCIGNEDFPWQCVNWTTPRPNMCQNKVGIVCSKYKRIRLDGGADVCEGELSLESKTANWIKEPCEGLNNSVLDQTCAKMKCGRAASVNPCNGTRIKCTDRVKVELRHKTKPSKCYGEITVNVNGSVQEVCVDGGNFIENVGLVVCKELGCGSPISVTQITQTQERMMSHLECDGRENYLWECIHQLGSKGMCRTISVICSGSVDVRLNYGLNECAGQLEIKFQDSGWKMSAKDWTKTNSDMVCQHLGCGASVDGDKHHFVKSTFPVLDWKMTCSDTDIATCMMQYRSAQEVLRDPEVNIICEKHELWFLQGVSPCEGRVKTETGGFLQSITREKAAYVCKQNHCMHSTNKNITITTSSDCPENSNSTLDCSEPQYAHVKCSGSRELRLQNKCYGKVLMCSEGKCGGIFEDTWTEAQSRMLCKVLGCGDVINGQYTGPKTAGVSVASVLCSKTAQNFSQCNFIQFKDTSFLYNPAYVSCTGSVRAEIAEWRDKCAGHVKLFYAGALQSLCTNGISKETPNALCSALSCGKAVSFDESINSTSKSYGVSGITCPGGNVSTCDFSNTRIIQCPVGFLNCTDWRRLLLTRTEACEGEVYVGNNENLYPVSGDGWSERESKHLCRYLNCGNASNSVIKRHSGPFWRKSYECGGNASSVWECETERIPTGKSHLHISCTDKPQVTLRNPCTGELRINKDLMCYKSGQTDRVFHELCHDLQCSDFFRAWPTKFQGDARYVSCTGYENKVWQCDSWTDYCEGVVSLACAKAITWRFSEECGGEVEVNYRGRWEPVCPLENHLTAERMCQEKKCGRAGGRDQSSVEKDVIVDVKITCTKANTYLMHCFKPEPKQCLLKASVYCEKYTPPRPPPDVGLIVGIVTGLVLLLAAAVIVFRKRETLLAVLRSKISPADESEFSQNEMESLNEKGAFETDDYDDIDVTENHMVHNNSKKLDSDPDEQDGSSTPDSSGTEYDDVDEETPKPPIIDPVLPPRPDTLLDVVTFEAEVEPQEDYDDVALPPQDELRDQGENREVPDPSSSPPLPLPDVEAQRRDDE